MEKSTFLFVGLFWQIEHIVKNRVKPLKKIHKIMLCLGIIVSLLVCSISVYQNIYADTKRTGTITGNNVYVRNAAGTTGSYKVTALNKGDTVEIIGETTVDGSIWYQVEGTVDGVSYTGWTISRYIQVHTQGNSEYANSLRKEGFPESYISDLVKLHEKYPDWTFEAVDTGLDWNYVIEKESRVGWNMVPKSFDDSRKSVSAGAYDWTTNQWTILDGSSWVAASSGYIAYCMDPRNFLDEESIFQFEKLSYSQNYTQEGVAAVLKDSFMSKTVVDSDGTVLNYAAAFMKIGQSIGVSPYHLAGRVKQEQGLAGSSSMISGTYKGYEGYYNYFNFGAYGITTDKVVQSGLAYAKIKGWNTRYQSLLGGATLLASSYISKGQDTLYFQKFNVVNQESLFSHQYMANVSAAITEGRSTAKGYTDKSQKFVFRIPIYENMPENRVTFTNTGNPNNYLKTLTVNGFSLTPVFKGTTTSYSLVVDSSVDKITVSASSVASTSTVRGTGTFTLKEGNNTISVICKAQNGDERTYTIKVAKEKSGTGEYKITSEKYTVGDYITGVSQNTGSSDFTKSFSVDNCSVKLLSAQGTEYSGTICTGNKLAIYQNNTLVKTYTIIVTGDVNGDGKVGMSDLVKVNRHILKIGTLEGIQKLAADVNDSQGTVTMGDLVKINRCILGLIEL